MIFGRSMLHLHLISKWQSIRNPKKHEPVMSKTLWIQKETCGSWTPLPLSHHDIPDDFPMFCTFFLRILMGFGWSVHFLLRFLLIFNLSARIMLDSWCDFLTFGVFFVWFLMKFRRPAQYFVANRVDFIANQFHLLLWIVADLLICVTKIRSEHWQFNTIHNKKWTGSQ